MFKLQNCTLISEKVRLIIRNFIQVNKVNDTNYAD
jgi:hypothetical protein